MKLRLESMTAHKGVCIVPNCKGIIKMPRHRTTLELLPDDCSCLQCGQIYFMEIEDIAKWEMEQWNQKVVAK